MKTRMLRHFLPIAAVLLAAAPFAPARAATVKALSFAINYANNSGDKTPIKNYMGANGVDFGIFDYTKASTYFIDADFTNSGRNFATVHYLNVANDHKFVIYDSDKYELVNVPEDDKSGNNIAAVFRDANGDTFALFSVRANYRDDAPNRVTSTLDPVVAYVAGITNRYPAAKAIVTYNAYLSGELNGNSYSNVLDRYLADSDVGPHMTRLGRTSGGGAYMYPGDVPATYSVTDVNDIGTKYPGTLVTLEYPMKYKVVFNDWDGTGLQTNIVYAGESVTPPVPQREGYTFTGWDHAASEFAAVSASFTATAQYALNAASLVVRGDPEELGTADPAYGSATAIAAGDSFTASVTMPALAEGATERWVCSGYTHYEITDVVTGAKTVAQEGSTASFPYTHVFHDELVWHFTNEWLVTASATAGGSVSASESWVRNGETATLVATPAEGYDFWRWDGDIAGIADVSSATIAPTVTAARSLRAVFAPAGSDASVQYVAPSGNDENDGYSPESPKLTIQAAVDTLAALPGYGTVHVAPGVYQAQSSQSTVVSDGVTAIVAITNAIAVIGDANRPDGVIVRNTSTFNTAQAIVLYLNHPGALVANLTAENGHRYAPQSRPYGSNVAIDAAGGTVSNCVIREANWAGNYARGSAAWLNSENAILTHCVVTNNSASGSGYQSTITGGKPLYGGIFVHVDKGSVANCLIADNHDSGGTGPVSQEKQAWACSVTIRDGTLLDCTVVTNEARHTGGVYLYPDGYATNVVVAGCVNRCTYPSVEAPSFTDIGFKGTLANASHCASDGGEALDETCVAGTMETFFRDVAALDYRPRMDSPLVDKGVAYDGLASLDLLGNSRAQGAPDIGCYENPAHGTLIFVK